MQREQDMERRRPERPARRREQGDRGPGVRSGLLMAVGGLALLGAATLVLINLPDIKRYIKISTM